jgi:hypothetical protein
MTMAMATAMTFTKLIPDATENVCERYGGRLGEVHNDRLLLTQRILWEVRFCLNCVRLCPFRV